MASIHRRTVQKNLHDPGNHDGVITHLEPDILECEVKWALESITTNKASGGDGIPVEIFQILKDDAVKVLHSICQQIWETQQWPQDWKRSIFFPNLLAYWVQHFHSIIFHMWNRSPVQVQCMRQGAHGWCTGITLRDRMGREVGERFRMGNTCTPMPDSCQCMEKTTTIL